jgi:hypothetical protein
MHDLCQHLLCHRCEAGWLHAGDQGCMPYGSMVYAHPCPLSSLTTCVSAVSAWGSQKVMSMAW